MNFNLGNFITAFSRVAPILTSIAVITNILVFFLGKRHKWKIGAGAMLSLFVIGIFYCVFSSPPQEDMWALKVKDIVPYCDAPILGTADWAVPDGAEYPTNVHCPDQRSQDQGLLMPPSSTSTPAEVDLDQIDGQTYSQTKLDAQVKVTFQNTQDDPDTMAGLLVQTPQQGKGGYGLWIDNIGDWQLEDNSGKIIEHKKVTPSSTGFTTLEIKVYQNNLYLQINGKQVFTCSDTLNPSVGGIGLVANGNNTSSSAIIFSDFTLSL